jgi:hypothetical protein
MNIVIVHTIVPGKFIPPAFEPIFMIRALDRFPKNHKYFFPFRRHAFVHLAPAAARTLPTLLIVAAVGEPASTATAALASEKEGGLAAIAPVSGSGVGP